MGWDGDGGSGECVSFGDKLLLWRCRPFGEVGGLADGRGGESAIARTYVSLAAHTHPTDSILDRLTRSRDQFTSRDARPSWGGPGAKPTNHPLSTMTRSSVSPQSAPGQERCTGLTRRMHRYSVCFATLTGGTKHPVYAARRHQPRSSLGRLSFAHHGWTKAGL